MMALNVLFEIFIVHGALIPLCICVGAYILKNYVQAFPNQLIPLANYIACIILTVFWMRYPQELEFSLKFRLLAGNIYGLACTGLHQLIKQTSMFFMFGQYKCKRQKYKIVSISNKENI